MDARDLIAETLYKFMRSFDEQDWHIMRECLSHSIYCDYSSFRNEKPATKMREEYVAERKRNLSHLRTQHNILNLSIDTETENQIAVAKCNYIIYRFDSNYSGSRDQFYHSYGRYQFEFQRAGNTWEIISIVQTVITNDGNPRLHGGIK